MLSLDQGVDPFSNRIESTHSVIIWPFIMLVDSHVSASLSALLTRESIGEFEISMVGNSVAINVTVKLRVR